MKIKDGKTVDDSRSKHSEKADKTAKVLLALFVLEEKLSPNQASNSRLKQDEK